MKDLILYEKDIFEMGRGGGQTYINERHILLSGLVQMKDTYYERHT